MMFGIEDKELNYLKLACSDKEVLKTFYAECLREQLSDSPGDFTDEEVKTVSHDTLLDMFSYGMVSLTDEEFLEASYPFLSQFEEDPIENKMVIFLDE